MALLDRRTISILLTILLFAAAGAVLYRAGHTLVLFLFAIFFAYLLDPAVSRLQRWSPLSKGSRGRAILQVYVVLALVLAVLLLVVGPRLVREGGRLGAALPDLLTRVTSGQILSQIGSKRGWSHESQLRLQQFLAGHREQILAWAQGFGVRAAQFVSRAFWLVLIPILAIFFLKDGLDFAAAVVATLERRNQRQLLRGVLDDVNVVVAHYIRAQGALLRPTRITRRDDGIYPVGRAARSCGYYPGCGLPSKLPTSTGSRHLPWSVAAGAGLRQRSSYHGEHSRAESTGDHLCCARWGRNRRRARCVPVNSHHGHVADRLATLADVLRC
jgi:hypothetical protein